ncbi:hypothetical protein B0H34DRAFT_246449 [Crassisporium funariophilum]|nr:hypothetical protein B0H34DRAFT_246449 [Crassisporium funariophilum]
MDNNRAAWDQERAFIKDKKMDNLHNRNNRLRSSCATALTQSTSELQTLIKTHGSVLFLRDSLLQGLLSAIGVHVHKQLEGFFGYWCVFFLLVLGTPLPVRFLLNGLLPVLCTMCRQKVKYMTSPVYV